MKTLILYSGIVSVFLLIAGIPIGFPAEEQEARDSFVDIRGNVVTEEGHPIANLSVRCKHPQQAIVREVLTNAQGAFTLTRLPSHIGTIDCEAGDDRLYAKAHRQIPVVAETQVTFTMDFQMLDQVQGWITVPKGSSNENALVQITRNGTTVGRRSTADGKVTFENLKAGPATVTYSAEGVPTMKVPGVLIAQGSDLSASLPYDWSPLGLPTYPGYSSAYDAGGYGRVVEAVSQGALLSGQLNPNSYRSDRVGLDIWRDLVRAKR